MSDKQKYLTNFLGRAALMTYFLMPVVSEYAFFYKCFMISALLLLAIAVILYIVWNRKHTGDFLEAFAGGNWRTDLEDALVLAVGVITNYFYGSKDESMIWLSLFVLTLLTPLLRHLTRKKGKNQLQ